MKVKVIKRVKKDDFDNVFSAEINKGGEDWEIIFDSVINSAEYFAFTQGFWYIGDFFTSRIVKVGGSYESATPLLEKDWVGLMPHEIGRLFHPDDLPKMEAFLVFMAGFLSKKTCKQRENIKTSKLFRMQDSKKRYTWRLMQYPKIHYENNMPRYVFCHISDYNHLVSYPKCTMFVLDKNTRKKTLFYCESATVVLKPFVQNKPLSARELEIIKLLCKGLMSKEIAAELKISKNTVENHKQNVFVKTGTRRITELVTFANDHHLLE